MATSKRTRMLRLGIVVATMSALAVGLSPGTSNATPPTNSAEAKKQIVALNDKLEPIIEQYNAAQGDLTKQKKLQGQAAARAKALDAKLQSQSGKVRQMASAAYRSMPFGEFTSVMSSGSPQEFLDQLSALDTLARRRGAAIQSLVAAKTQAVQAQQQAQAAATKAQKLFTTLQSQKSSIEGQVQQAQTLLDQLSASERQALFASTHGGGGDFSYDASNLPPAPNAKAQAAVDAALSKLGSDYVWAAAGPDVFDCSGLMLWAWQAGGVSLPHQSGQQYNAGTHVSKSELQPGDMVFFYSPIHHVGMYIGNGLMVHAPQTGDVVKITSIDNMPYTGATRVW